MPDPDMSDPAGSGSRYIGSGDPDPPNSPDIRPDPVHPYSMITPGEAESLVENVYSIAAAGIISFLSPYQH